MSKTVMIKKVTIRNYPADLCISAIQKGIRRCDFINAAYFAVEIFESGWHYWAWKRLFTCSAEDVADFVTTEVKSLYDCWEIVNKGNKTKNRGRVFLVKAVWVLCHANKSRDTDNLTHFIYDEVRNYPPHEELQITSEHRAIPEYAYDCHTEEGRKMGATKEGFFTEEDAALTPLNPLVENFINIRKKL